MIDTSKLSTREKLLWGSFRLDQPIGPSNSKFIQESYARFCEAKRADIAATEEAQKCHDANPYRNPGAGVKEVPATNSRGTF